MIDEALLGVRHIVNGDDREIEGVVPAGRGIYAGGSGRPLAAPEDIRTNHKILVRIERPTRADHGIPPPGIIMLCVNTGSVRVTGKGVEYKYGVCFIFVQSPVGLIGER